MRLAGYTLAAFTLFFFFVLFKGESEINYTRVPVVVSDNWSVILLFKVHAPLNA